MTAPSPSAHAAAPPSPAYSPPGLRDLPGRFGGRVAPLDGIGVPFLDRRARQCAWPLADMPVAHLRCCGSPVLDATRHPYCDGYLDVSAGLPLGTTAARRSHLPAPSGQPAVRTAA